MGRVRVWDAGTGALIAERDHESDIFRGGAVFSPDGTRVVSWGGNERAVLWDAATGGELVRFDGQISGAIFSPDGRRLLSWAEKTVTVWNVQTGTVVVRQSYESERPGYVRRFRCRGEARAVVGRG